LPCGVFNVVGHETIGLGNTMSCILWDKVELEQLQFLCLEKYLMLQLAMGGLWKITLGKIDLRDIGLRERSHMKMLCSYKHCVMYFGGWSGTRTSI